VPPCARHAPLLLLLARAAAAEGGAADGALRLLLAEDGQAHGAHVAHIHRPVRARVWGGVVWGGVVVQAVRWSRRASAFEGVGGVGWVSLAASDVLHFTGWES